MFRRKCDACHENALFVSIREIEHPVIGKLKSHGKLCRKCYKKLTKATQCTT